ncbi:MAG: PQQ-dependent sugar dehydrogenase, partial [Planctomycetota bacterium]
MTAPHLPLSPIRVSCGLAAVLWLHAVISATCLAQPPATEPVDQSRLELTELARGLVQPMELDVAADGTVYFIELGGRLRAISPGSSEVRLVGELRITTEQENGLIGMALHPDFTQNG